MLKLLLLLPLLGALLTGAWPGLGATAYWRIALVPACAALLFAAGLAWHYDPAGPLFQFVESRAWNARLGSHFALGVDGVAVAMLLLTAVLTLVAILISRHTNLGGRLYYSLLLLLEAAIFGVFSARDWSLFYVFWEATLIPLFFLIDRLGGENRQKAALNFFLYTLGGSVFMLVALLFLYDAAPGHSFAMSDMAAGGQALGARMQVLIFAGLFIGFAVKMPVFPLHGWLPLVHVEAPGPVSILLSGILLKMGAYGLIRAAQTLPAGLLSVQDILVALAFVSLLYGGILAWRQQDMKAMVAYSSIAHMGIVLLGVATLRPEGFAGAIFQMVAHGLLAGLLFLVVGLLYRRQHSRNLADYESLTGTAPRFVFFVAFAFLALLGLPGSAGFIAELQVLLATLASYGAWAGLLGLALLIAAAASLRVVGRLCLPGKPMALQDMHRGEVAAAALLATAILLLGCWPAPLLTLIGGSVAALAAGFGS